MLVFIEQDVLRVTKGFAMDMDKHWSKKTKKEKSDYFDKLEMLFGERKSKSPSPAAEKSNCIELGEFSMSTPIYPSSIKENVSKSKFKPKKRIGQILSEDEEQIRLVVWLQKQGIKVAASGNGGSRHYLEAVKLKRMGISSGYPDLFIPIPSGSYHGLFIEMKRTVGGKVSELQKDWLNYLEKVGYYAKVAYGAEEGKKIVTEYLSFTPKAA